jgi:hypothetical protein
VSNPQLTDLGVWNIFANPDSSASGKDPRDFMPNTCHNPALTTVRSDEAIARFKPRVSVTSGIPRPTCTTVSLTPRGYQIGFYIGRRRKQPATLRNAAGALQGILTQADISHRGALKRSMKIINEGAAAHGDLAEVL